MKCPPCGRENRDGAGFCAWCGAALSRTEPKPEPKPAADETNAPAAASARGRGTDPGSLHGAGGSLCAGEDGARAGPGARPLPEFLTAETDEYRAAMAAADGDDGGQGAERRWRWHAPTAAL
jgi:hypothetical protein